MGEGKGEGRTFIAFHYTLFPTMVVDVMMSKSTLTTHIYHMGSTPIKQDGWQTSFPQMR